MTREERIKQLKKRKRAAVIIFSVLLLAFVLVALTVLINRYLEGRTSDGVTVDSELIPEDENKDSDESGDAAETDENLVTPDGIELFKGTSVYESENTKVIAESDDMQSIYAILVDAESGEIIGSKDGLSRMNPASMTKVMTVLVAAEHISEDELDTPITITLNETDYSFKYDLSAAGFEVDETVTIRDLFYGTILPSGADAAMALARYVAGSEEDFVALMNEKVSELGLKDTHFTNVAGRYDEEHYSTCADIAVIMKEALLNPVCYEALTAHMYTTSITEAHPEGIELSNWFLRRIEDKEELFNGRVYAAKTGYVPASGNCAVSYELNSEGHPYICVTAGAHSVWRCIYDQVTIYSGV